LITSETKENRNPYGNLDVMLEKDFHVLRVTPLTFRGDDLTYIFIRKTTSEERSRIDRSLFFYKFLLKKE
jgi:hypothetical protein